VTSSPACFVNVRSTLRTGFGSARAAKILVSRRYTRSPGGIAAERPIAQSAHVRKALEVARKVCSPGAKCAHDIEAWRTESVVLAGRHEHSDALAAAGKLDFRATFDVSNEAGQVIASFGKRYAAGHDLIMAIFIAIRQHIARLVALSPKTVPRQAVPECGAAGERADQRDEKDKG
jgi:hypothetical protein